MEVIKVRLGDKVNERRTDHRLRSAKFTFFEEIALGEHARIHVWNGLGSNGETLGNNAD